MRATEKCPKRKPLEKIIWSWLGSFIGILAVAYLAKYSIFDSQSYLFLTGAFGATAVLIYGAPMAEFSQPRNLIGGHLLSAIIGVSINKATSLGFLNIEFACALAVSVAIAIMHFTRTMHPPGGATALIAVIGGKEIQQMGYWYVLFPVLSGAFIMLFVALVINNMSSNPKRQYPVYWL